MPAGKGAPRGPHGLPNRVQCTLEGPRESPVVSHETEVFDLGTFEKNLKIKILECKPQIVVLELKGCDASLANALRRILISEIWQNTGVVQDEVLAHRLGLIPFKVNPKKLKFRNPNQELSEENSLKFKMHVKCSPGDLKPHQKSMPVYARDLKWIPMSERQKQKFAQDPPAPVHPDILITKLRPGQEIELFGFLEKGLGKTHAKWSPVATAVYRLEPEFVFTSPIEGEEAKELKELCPMGVFDIEDSTGRAYAKFPRNCTTCRACLERFENQLQLNKIPDQFIFSIESTGSVPAPELFEMAVEVLLEKAITFREIIRTKQLE
ncbi:DNA-directed RNA polymerases I and III subunit RPAC1, putative [Eimeria tenella]|uniref:DNA-directed RNA polymerases I and III subunit RPAC1, putative n=1 Tax=Eimeria tenella TaxID=5802 RepID=U6KRY9_EIMTE|nr:DNA-directed RNA polymerases I and III subunit RPAC1, putative [Eimeria tenella]CDJ38198.1 DNA-directed RNA polymerases I and III subunit RPAC1, putative [Eimeria tenella]|eukprot:XP_013229036.1 DNA-directed RNA polymerases I and III subunit RPAC1, putative [Eimeria tenella]